MRLWHKDLISVIPRQQLVSQWRECRCIAKNIFLNGTPNHILVNKIMDYPLSHFYAYGLTVYIAMKNRGYKCDFYKFDKYFNEKDKVTDIDNMFQNWHTERYLAQNYYNLQEKFDCGAISEKEWKVLMNRYHKLINYSKLVTP